MMTWTRQLLACSLIGIFCTFALRGQDDDIRRDATVRVVQQVMPSVADILTKSTVPVQDPFEFAQRRFFGQREFDEYISAGSGVVIDEDGYLLTNEHVIHGANQIAVRFGAQTNEYEATVVGSDPKIDIALLKLKGRPGEKFHAIKFAREDDLLLGETVLALGNALGLGGSVTRGILSSKSRMALRAGEQPDYRNWLQTDAPINPGNSGGPLIDLRGELIGVNVSEATQAQGIGFAIPIRMVEDALSDDFPSEFVRSFWFGARVKVGSYPLVITSVQTESPAGHAGLKIGDEVMQVNGKVPKNFINFGELLASNAPAEFPITIRRGDNISDVDVRLVPESEVFNAKMVRDKLGLTLENGPSGFIITDVEAKSPAAAAGLQPQMIVRAIDLRVPESITGVAKALYVKKKGDPVLLDLALVGQVGGIRVVQPARIEVAAR